MSEVRPLSFPLNYAASLTALVDEGSEAFDLPEFPSDSDERIDVIMSLSLNEFIKLATAIDVGSDIAYGEDAVAIWYIWVRSIMSESLCEKITDCVNENSGTRNAISNLFLTNTSEQYYDQLLEKLKEDLEEPVVPVNPAPSCNDNLWGAIVQFVDIITKDVTDFLELIDANPADQGLELINVLSNLPVVDEIGVDTLTNFAVWVADQLQTYWLASLTDEYREGLACDVFCRVKDGCAVSVDDVYQVILARVNPQFNIENLIDVASNLTQFVFTGASDFVCDTWLFAMFRFASLGDVLFKATGVRQFAYATTRLRKQLMLGLNNPDSDWSLLCTNCNPSAQLEIYATNGTATLGFDGLYYTLTCSTNAFVAIRRIGANQNNCLLPFKPINISVVSGNPTGREWRNCPSGTFNSANAPVTQANGNLMSYLAVSNSTSIGGSAFSIEFRIE